MMVVNAKSVQGTAPHAAAAAEVTHPAKQGLVQAFSVYVDTLFVCSATAFIILSTGTLSCISYKTTRQSRTVYKPIKNIKESKISSIQSVSNKFLMGFV
jgi:Na+/alanine symporter